MSTKPAVSGPDRRKGGSRARARAHSARDQVESAFSAILSALVEAVPLAAGAALVDAEGETVDYAGYLDPFDLKVAAAHFGVVLHDIRSFRPLSTVKEVRVRAKQRAYLLRILDADYSLILVLHKYSGFSVSHRALRETESRLCIEAGLERSDLGPMWYRVEVETRAGRPLRLRAPSQYAELKPPVSIRAPSSTRAPTESRDPLAWVEVEVIGALMGTLAKERGFRVRLANGAEMTLIRERNRLWFVDEPL